ncbi:hypothetical protein [Undibacterium sp.]|jgi:hypothetical protein|uniref:hypothetical protein n=1 Tax=Undibacterium sp. TaxID=1914977 RepID=UPI002B65BA52|nr:hypothetical protein [Undibacterium sp.]HTD07080.1 hypothetical protein [Undibacterium sp.]
MNQLSISLLAALALAACSSKTDLNRENISAGMNAYLAKRGDLCLAKNVWPIDVSQKDVDTGGRNAIQMPVLEKLGLVQSAVATVTATEEGVSAEIKVRRYALTEAGKKYYLNKEMRSVKSDGDIQLQQGDLCAAKLSLDQVVGWEEAKTGDGEKMVAVSYTYKVDAAPWTADADVQKVFPMVDRVVRGAGSMQLKESFKQTAAGWVAVDL